MSPRAWEERVRCPCCGCPTLAADIPDQSCVLCEWLVDGLPADDEAGAEELSTAREHFRRYLSMYAPDDRPPWSPDPPTPEELEVKRDLVALYAEVLAEQEGDDAGDSYGDHRPEAERGWQKPRGLVATWTEIVRLERRVEEMEKEYSLQIEAGELDELEDEELRGDDAADRDVPDSEGADDAAAASAPPADAPEEEDDLADEDPTRR